MNELKKSDVLARSLLGPELDEADCAALAERMGSLSLSHGEGLVEEGDPRRTLFTLADGRLSVCKIVGDTEEVVYQMRPGECAGTRAFVDGSNRRAALRSEGESQVLTLEPEDFEILVDAHPRLGFKVMRALFRITHGNLMRMNLESSELRKYLLKTGGRY